jgi:hypothetical protein
VRAGLGHGNRSCTCRSRRSTSSACSTPGLACSTPGLACSTPGLVCTPARRSGRKCRSSLSCGSTPADDRRSWGDRSSYRSTSGRGSTRASARGSTPAWARSTRRSRCSDGSEPSGARRNWACNTNHNSQSRRRTRMPMGRREPAPALVSAEPDRRPPARPRSRVGTQHSRVILRMDDHLARDRSRAAFQPPRISDPSSVSLRFCGVPQTLASTRKDRGLLGSAHLIRHPGRVSLTALP